MNLKIAVKVVALGALIVAAGYWLRDHELLTRIVVSLLILFVLAKLAAAILWHRRGWPPHSGGRGPSDRAGPRPPSGRPPQLSAARIIKEVMLLGACASLLSGCCTARVTSANWEYQIVDGRMFVPLMDAINQRAKDGWELMSVHPPPPNSELSFAVMRRARK